MANRRFNINEFTAEVNKRGIGKPNYFSVMISLPSRLGGFFNTSFLPLRIERASLPARSLDTIVQRYHGPERMIPYAFSYQPMTLQVLLSENMIEREIFMAWQDMAVSAGGLASYRRGGGKAPKQGGFDSTYYDEMIGGVEIMQFAESPKFQNPSAISIASSFIRGDTQSLINDVIDAFNPLNRNEFESRNDRVIFPQYKIRLEEAYPIAINDVDLDWSADGAAKMTVQMRYFISTEKHPDALPFENLYGLESLLRGAVNALDRFSPLVSLFARQGLGGGIRGLTQQTGVIFRNSATAQRGALF